jgi:hypothetical protein
LPVEFKTEITERERERENCGPMMGSALIARQIAAVENAADGLWKGMKHNVGITTSPPVVKRVKL